MRCRWVCAAAAVLTVLPAFVAASSTVVGRAAVATEATDGAGGEAGQARDRGAAMRLLNRAVETARTARYSGRLTVASFGRGGPQVTAVEVTRNADGRLHATRRGAWELGRDADGSYLRTTRTGSLLRLGGIDRDGFDRDRFLRHYRVEHGGTSALDTGLADALLVTRRQDGVRAETLYVDDRTGLIVRRETRDHEGRPVRVVAYTDLEVDAGTGLIVPPAADEGVERLALTPVARQALLERGVPVAATLPGGYELLDLTEIDTDDATSTVHLVYSDGLYTLSLYLQQGRLAPSATAVATALDLPDGGMVWRWPGSEPRRVVWSGAGWTYTAITDAPTGDLLTAVAGLPNDPAPSTLRRLARGLSRVGDRLLPPWG